MIEKLYPCKYCNAKFAKEKTLSVHMCEQKRRYLQKDERRVQLGFQTFVRFYELCQKATKTKTYEEFCKSPYYTAFVKFGSFLSNVKPLYPNKYIDYVVTSGVKLDHWCREELYQKYAVDLILRERVETAMERSIKTMMDWADEKNAPWNDYFKYASLNRVVMDIKDGKVSPWLILNCKTGKAMMKRFNDEQLQIVYPIMDPSHWTLRFKRLPADVEMVKEVTREAKL